MTASGGTLDESDVQFTDAELQAIAETAHALGRKVTAHAHGKDAIDACVRAGFDSIEHAMWADAESLKAHGVWLIPTVIRSIMPATRPRRCGHRVQGTRDASAGGPADDRAVFNTELEFSGSCDINRDSSRNHRRL